MPTAVIYDKWLAGLGGGEVVACEVARTLKDNGYDVLFLSRDVVATERIRETLGIDLSDITFKQIKNESDLRLTTNDQRLSTIDLFINISFMDYSYGIGKKNIYYVHFPTLSKKSIFFNLSKIKCLNGIYVRYLLNFPTGLFNYVLAFFNFTKLHHLLSPAIREKIDDRLRAGIYHNLPRRLNSYDTFIVHSKYVKKWVKKAWNKSAFVLYPPVKLINSKPSTLNPKQNWICSVGRFFTLGHGKKQEIMIEAFKKLYQELPSTNDLELHLVGGVGSEPSSLRFIENLREQAKGYPIFFHFNVKRKEVEEVLLKSKIYWHAGGFGEDQEKNPINFEHFGIAPVEAISAGCVPILFDGGGLPEIIRISKLDSKLNLFRTTDELINDTKLFLKRNSHKNNIDLSIFGVVNYKKSLLKLLVK
jgi:glycosyltransferase involved in cell wall biosynthesis